MDLYHCQVVEGDVAMKIRHYLPTGSVGHLQIAGVPRSEIVTCRRSSLPPAAWPGGLAFYREGDLQRLDIQMRRGQQLLHAAVSAAVPPPRTATLSRGALELLIEIPYLWNTERVR